MIFINQKETDMTSFKVLNRVYYKITSFYYNVQKKYPISYSDEDVSRYIQKTYDSIFQIKPSGRRKPIIKRWEGYYMYRVKNWYFAFYIAKNGQIVVVDACHRNNMHDWKEIDKPLIIESSNHYRMLSPKRKNLRRWTKSIVTEVLSDFIDNKGLWKR